MSLEVINTQLPAEAKVERSTLKALCQIPKMSTYAIGAMINFGVSCMPHGTSFVNVGVWHGFSFLSGMIGNYDKKCIGIDNFSEFGGPRDQFMKRFEIYKGTNHFFFEKDYLQYFSEIHDNPIGFYLYDGDHKYENQLCGLRIAEPFFSKNCIIMIDDTNWEEPRQATLDFIKTSQKNYQILQDSRTSCKTHPTLWNGIIIFQGLD